MTNEYLSFKAKPIIKISKKGIEKEYVVREDPKTTIIKVKMPKELYYLLKKYRHILDYRNIAAGAIEDAILKEEELLAKKFKKHIDAKKKKDREQRMKLYEYMDYKRKEKVNKRKKRELLSMVRLIEDNKKKEDDIIYPKLPQHYDDGDSIEEDVRVVKEDFLEFDDDSPVAKDTKVEKEDFLEFSDDVFELWYDELQE